MTFSLPAQEITFQPPEPSHPILVDATQITTWQEGQTQVIHLQGDVVVSQESFRGTADDAILWVHQLAAPGKYRVVTYLESFDGNVVVDLSDARTSADGQGVPEERIVDAQWLGRLYTYSSIDSAKPAVALQGDPPQVMQRARQALRQGGASAVVPVQYPQQPQRLISPQTGQVQEIMEGPAPRQDPFRGQFDRRHIERLCDAFQIACLSAGPDVDAFVTSFEELVPHG